MYWTEREKKISLYYLASLLIYFWIRHWMGGDLEENEVDPSNTYGSPRLASLARPTSDTASPSPAPTSGAAAASYY